jgi:hypothetical protein
MVKDHFKAPSINTDDPENLEIFSLAKTSHGELVAEELKPNIYVIRGALTDDEIKYLDDLARTATSEDWERYYKSYFLDKGEPVNLTEENERNYWYDKSMEIGDLEFCEGPIKRVKPFFGDGYHLPLITHVHRQKVGEGMDEHSDMGERSKLLRSAIFYVNDDYEGGELYFPALDFEYKPKAGDFITFPSYEKFTHGVKPVLSGSDRYVLAGFAWQSENL